MARIAGTLFVKINGVQHNAIGDFTYNLGLPKREMVIGADRIHGYKEMPQVAFIEGEIRDATALDIAALFSLLDATVTLELANDKTVVVREATQVAEGNVGTENANISIRFEGISGEEFGVGV